MGGEPVRVLIAPDSFKGTYRAAEVAEEVAAGAESAGLEAIRMPVADGGDGTLDVLTGPLGLELIEMESVNPWRAPCSGSFGLGEDGTAVVELATFSGITTPHKGFRDPMTADTYGTGLAMVEALRRGATHIVVAAGGSATTDGGLGAITAIVEAGGLGTATVTVLTDVTTRYADAAVVFGPQKGADETAVERLTRRLEDAAVTLPRDPREVDGTGAAGGFAGGMWAQFGADLRSGAEFVLDAVGFDAALAGADLVVVGEGRLDGQSRAGKIVSAILARVHTVPVVAVVGSVGDDLGDYRDRFAEIMVATDLDAMRAAGARLARRA
ncbi:glycerate kinase [Rhodococcus aetherivorans]|uniref:glycerate kinase n=1 Tax=Rhodococcus TaxID=1827 RepID=UPI0013866CE7|nr:MULTISPECIES: glycerate kinase [Rhodococcus]NCL77342.1 Glycerate 3-kinase [Rhodococcus sp. YH1]QRI75167.1 glycerate kinase [Rhodococcus aetherivorans]QSE58575.1 glycerate kinase [Rhodococcus sp. PSBB066]QSE70101.1 glycerate kinase [Rhodococcus sp. PSBB049]